MAEGFKVASGWIDVETRVNDAATRAELAKLGATKETVTVKTNLDRKSLKDVSTGILSGLAGADKLGPGLTAMIPALGGVAALGPAVGAALGAVGLGALSAGAGAGVFLAVAKDLPATKKGVADLSKTWTGFSHSLSGVVSPVVTRGFAILMSLIPMLRPLVVATAGAFGDLETRIGAVTSGPEFKAFMAMFAKLAGGSIRAIGSLLGGIAMAAMHLAIALGPAVPLIDDAASAFGRWLSQITDTKAFSSAIAAMIRQIPGAMAFFKQLGTIGLAAIKGVLAVALPLFRNVIQPMIAFLAAHSADITKFAAGLTGVMLAMKALSIVAAALNVVLDANPIGLVVLAVAALAAGLIHAYQTSETFRNTVQSAFTTVKTIAAEVVSVFTGLFSGSSTPSTGGFAAKLAGIWQALVGLWNTIRPIVVQIATYVVNLVRQNWPKIQQIISLVMTDIRGIIQVATALIKVLWDAFGTYILARIKIAFDLIMGVVKGALTVIKGIINVALGLIHGNWQQVWDGLRQILSGVWTIIKSVVKAAIATVKATLQLGLSLIKSAWSTGWNAVKSLLSGVWGSIKQLVRSGVADVVGVFLGMVSTIIHGAASAFGWVPGLGGKLRTAATQFDQFKTRANNAIRGITPNKTVNVGVRDDVSTAVSHIKAAMAELHDKTINIRTYETTVLQNIRAPSIGTGRAVASAAGGPLAAGQVSLVGDGGGPELFVPNVPGNVLDTKRTAEVLTGAKKANSAGGTTNHNNYNFQITIPAKDLAEVKSVTDLFNKLEQAARAGGATLARTG